mmetsp:Transcript_52445/g.125314  ORF Transcript_52445/g.125314 Transcript_52445/m.125314 type:complete len:172 (-) Transcript_52445:58-573(-)
MPRRVELEEGVLKTKFWSDIMQKEALANSRRRGDIVKPSRSTPSLLTPMRDHGAVMITLHHKVGPVLKPPPPPARDPGAPPPAVSPYAAWHKEQGYGIDDAIESCVTACTTSLTAAAFRDGGESALTASSVSVSRPYAHLQHRDRLKVAATSCLTGASSASRDRALAARIR